MQLATEKPGHEVQFEDILLTLDKASKDSTSFSDILSENQQRTGSSEFFSTIDMTPKMLTLNILSGPLHHGSVSNFSQTNYNGCLNITQLEKFLDLMCRFSGEPVSRYITFQQLSWTLEAESGTCFSPTLC